MIDVAPEASAAAPVLFGMRPFELLMGAALLFQVVTRVAEWIFKRTQDADDFVRKPAWEKGRRDDVEEARHFTRAELDKYVPQRVYDRDWKETNRRLQHLEGMGQDT